MAMMDTLKAKLLEMRKAQRAVELTVLQVVLGEASQAEARSGTRPTDDEVEKIIRKTMLGNTETMGLMEKQPGREEARAKLATENAFLQTLLPATMSEDAIVAALADIADAIKGAKNDGAATGAAMKHLKAKNLKALGDAVSAAVKRLRAAT